MTTDSEIVEAMARALRSDLNDCAAVEMATKALAVATPLIEARRDEALLRELLAALGFPTEHGKYIKAWLKSRATERGISLSHPLPSLSDVEPSDLDGLIKQLSDISSYLPSSCGWSVEERAAPHNAITALQQLREERDELSQLLGQTVSEREKYNGAHQRACLEIARLREALAPFAWPPVYIFDNEDAFVPTKRPKDWTGGGYFTTAEFRAARAALSTGGKSPQIELPSYPHGQAPQGKG